MSLTAITLHCTNTLTCTHTHTHTQFASGVCPHVEIFSSFFLCFRPVGPVLLCSGKDIMQTRNASVASLGAFAIRFCDECARLFYFCLSFQKVGIIWMQVEVAFSLLRCCCTVNDFRCCTIVKNLTAPLFIPKKRERNRKLSKPPFRIRQNPFVVYRNPIFSRKKTFKKPSNHGVLSAQYYFMWNIGMCALS